MSRKCACCDTQYDLTFVPDNDDYMCGECYCGEYHSLEFSRGSFEAEMDVLHGDVYDIRKAIEAFVNDPPDNAFHYGYLYGLKSELENECFKHQLGE